MSPILLVDSGQSEPVKAAFGLVEDIFIQWWHLLYYTFKMIALSKIPIPCMTYNCFSNM